MYRLANDKIIFELAQSLQTAELKSVATGRGFRCDKVFQLVYGNYYRYHLPEQCESGISADGDSLTVTFSRPQFWSRFRTNGYHKPEPGPDLKIVVQFSLDDDQLIIRLAPVGNLADEECRLIVAQNFLAFDSGETAQLVFPYGFGVQFDFPRRDYLKQQYSAGWGYSLPCYGLFRDDGGLGVYLKTPYDAVTELDFNSRQRGRSGVETQFLFEKELANAPREMRLRYFEPGGDFRTLANWYRAIVQAEGRFRSLADKIAVAPEVEKLVGAVVWKHNVYSAERPEHVSKGYSLYMMAPDQNECEGLPNNWTAREVFDTAKANGFDRVCVLNTGWNRFGFDSGYPSRLPPNPERGTPEEFSQAAAYGRSLSDGYLYSVHDNYIDAYRNSPEYDEAQLIRNAEGATEKGGIWRGGRSRFLCTSQSVEYARRDLPKVAALVGRGCIYLDVLGTVQLFSCHHPLHPQGRQQDALARRQVFSLAKMFFGAVATEGVPGDSFADLIDLGAYMPIHFLDGTPLTDPQPVPVPLWQLVYHDSVLNYCSESTYRFYGSEYRLLQAAYALLPTQFDAHSHRLSFELRDAYRAAMTDFEFLEKPEVRQRPDGCFQTDTVTQSVFADGTIVIANFLDRKYRWGEHLIPPREFIILKEQS